MTATPVQPAPDAVAAHLLTVPLALSGPAAVLRPAAPLRTAPVGAPAGVPTSGG
ncbi:hypothetical protein SAMN05660642_00761 [Geodermatophilus siccatus]|uniref:Uncharacterized protein n=1 Tax=Geodermatophilus siccatus TaxID=1137991 RepID=A0A1G9MSY9_9ACTN|nr:hypothetical protein [Geodermatophilus siccatus]SDL77233.1 hypothetical protein SAMN05660642_00761 [Geodermatophilus siccatus]